MQDLHNLNIFTKIKAITFLVGLAFIFSVQNICAQNTFTDASLAEKIYLQLDKVIYTTGSTIWFKSIVTNSYSNRPTDISSVLHVELIGDQKNTIAKKLIKLNKGIGEGYFDLTETLPAGTYLIRAYTEWNKNFDQDFIFEKYIEVFSVYDEIANESKRYYQSTDSLAKTTTVPIIAYNPKIDLQFFPESGEMVHGLPSKVGFKALNAFGKGKMIEGAILDEANNTITTFKSNALGMGSFTLNKVDINKTYYAKLSNQSKDSLYVLPKVAPIGDILSVIEKNSTIILTGISNYMKSDSIYLNVSSRGLKLFATKLKLQNGTFRFTIESEKLPEGIITFTLTGNNNHKIAERLYFNKRPKNNLNIKITTDKASYSKRDLTNLSIKTVNENGEPINTNASVLVINKEQLGSLQNSRDHILSYLLLSSELKGHIENPRYYFNENEDRKADLDALMLTQGWRNYKYNQSLYKLSFDPERNLTISGKAVLTQGKRDDLKVDLTMVTYGKGEVLYMQPTDSLGHFKFDLDDEFGDNVKVLISAKQAGKRVGINFLIDEEESPPITFEQKTVAPQIQESNAVFVEKTVEKQKIENDYFSFGSNIALDEVVVTGRNLTPTQQKVIDRFGEPDKIIEGTDIKEKEKNWSSGIYSILHFNFRDKVIIKSDSAGNQSIIALNGMITLVVIDGIPVPSFQYHNIQHIQAEQILSVEVIEFAKTFKRFYCEVYPLKCGGASPSRGNVVAIYTKAGKGIYGAYPRKSKSLGEINIPVFAESREFYAPRYDTMPAEDAALPDLRALIHWQPVLETNSSGIAQTSFYNGDITGDIMVIVEAITENGDIDYKELNYKVE